MRPRILVQSSSPNFICVIRILRLGVLLLFSFIVLLPSAHAAPPAFHSYTTRDGLAADYVTSIAFAPDGALWVGTARGVTRAQDQNWVTYTTAHGLANDWISGIAPVTASKIYLATNGGGLTLFDGATRKTYDIGNSAIPSNFLTALAVDRQGRVWVGTLGAGVARLEGETWSQPSLANNYVNALALDANDHPWVATNEGAFFFDGKTWTRHAESSGLASSRVFALAIARDGRVWFGTDDGVTVYDGKTYRTYRTSDGLADARVRALAVDAQNRVWVGTARGVSLLAAGKWTTYARADGLADDAATALALDARGNVWVGTPRGLSAFGGARLPRATTLPVVLVHGWHTAASDQLDDTEFRYLRRWLERDGFQVFYATGISPYKTLVQNAAALRDAIADAKAKTGAPRVDILAFSMGGLNTRAYIESALYQDDVRRAILLGTPQAGARLWYALLTREIELRPHEPSVIELTPEYAALFNRTHAPRATVPYDLLAGDARTQANLELLEQFPPSDGLIDVWSAHALDGPQVRRITNSDVHDWYPAPLPFELTGLLYPAQTYERFIRNALRDPDTRPIGFTAAPVAEPAPRNITPLNAARLGARATVTQTIVLDANRAARWIARWDRGDVQVFLRAPDGTRYTPETVRDSISSSDVIPRVRTRQDLLDAMYLKADIGSIIVYSIPHAQPGAWSLIATRLDQGRETQTLTTYADLDAELRLTAKTDRAWYPFGAPVVVEATLSNREAGADVRAQVQWLGDGVSPRGSPLEFALLEEGEPGTYADLLTGLTRGGYYLLRVTARGKGWAREQQTIFAMSPQTAAFVGAAHARVQDGALVMDAMVRATRAGAFALGVTARGTRGQLVASLTAPLTLAVGAQPVSVAIPGREIRARGVDGPYAIELVLMDANWVAVPVDELALTTDAYRASDF